MTFRRPSIMQLSSCLDDFDPNAVPVRTAQSLIGQWLDPVAAIERVNLREGLGRILAKDLLSTLNVPAHDNAAMDGWAIRGADLDASGGGNFTIAPGTAFAGKPWSGVLAPAQTVRIFTGAVMPVGSDTVIAQEVAEIQGEQSAAAMSSESAAAPGAAPSSATEWRTAGDVTLHVPSGQKIGQHRRFAGEDLALGSVALHAGSKLGPAHLGLAASLGMSELSVRRKLRVAFFSTGDELRSIGEPLGPGDVYDSNRYTLWSMLNRLGVEVVDLGVVRDDPHDLETALRAAADGADAVISSGGVSVGEADFTRDVMAKVGEVAFWKIAMRPGRPMAVGRVGEAIYFGLPGNPVAVMITFLFFVRDALLKLSGSNQSPCMSVPVRVAEPVRKRPGRTEYQRAVVSLGEDGNLSARITGQQGSGVLSSMARANAILVFDHDQCDLAAGDRAQAFLLEALLA